ncbi:MAG TPA: diaminopimelate epimerase [Lachnospiraceae bacterium]|nr:diaminopimelate epimerase [Lachnospiraceae bacterium]
MKFTKMHGCGNDYVYVNAIDQKVEDPAKIAVMVSDRHFGIGSDGLILIKASDKADFEMQMFNADGSEGAMCGNGIRCVGKYVYDFGLTDKTQIKVNTKSGVKILDLKVEEGKVSAVRVNMGEPVFEAEKIPVISRTPQVIDLPLTVDGAIYRCTAVSMGNPHCVTFIGNVDNLEIDKIGPKFENHTAFPDRVNTEFIKLIDDHTIQMRVWERGSGETLACGTGACASAVAAILTEKVKGNKVTVKLLGGTLEIEWDRESNQVYLMGPATTVFNGEIDI